MLKVVVSYTALDSSALLNHGSIIYIYTNIRISPHKHKYFTQCIRHIHSIQQQINVHTGWFMVLMFGNHAYANQEKTVTHF